MTITLSPDVVAMVEPKVASGSCQARRITRRMMRES
jgi:hypothetical protein